METLQEYLLEIDYHLDFKYLVKMEKIKTEFDMSGQTMIISHDENKVIIFEQKLDRTGNLQPVEGGLYAIFFSAEQSVEKIFLMWEEFEYFYQTCTKNHYKAIFDNLPIWFERYDTHYKKYQLIYH
jgi:hypothetical protein